MVPSGHSFPLWYMLVKTSKASSWINVGTVNLTPLLALLFEMGSSVAQAGLKLTMYLRVTLYSASPCYAAVLVRPLSPAISCLFRDRILTYIPCCPQTSECWDYGNAPSQAWLGVLCFKMHPPPPRSPEQCVTILKVERGRRGNQNEPLCNGNLQSVSLPMAHFHQLVIMGL